MANQRAGSGVEGAGTSETSSAAEMPAMAENTVRAPRVARRMGLIGLFIFISI